MLSEILGIKAKDERMIGLQFSQHEERSSLQHHSSKSHKEKCLFPSRIKNIDLSEKVGALKTEKLPRQTAKDQQEVKKNSVASPLGTPQKPWPSRKVTGVEGPIMNMSNVPFYLQHIKKGDDIHEKALSFGVLDWRLLERWTYHQNGAMDVGGGDSASSTPESSTFSISNQSCRTMSSPLSGGKKSPVFPRKKLPVIGSQSKMCEKEDSRYMEGFRGSRISSPKFPTQHDKHPDEDLFLSADLLDHKHDKGNSKDSDLKAMFSEICLPPHSATSSSRYKIDDATAASVAEDQNVSLMKTENSVDCSNSLRLANDTPRFSHDSKGIWDYLQESVDSRCLRFDSPLTTDGWLAERNGNNHSGNLAEDGKFIHQHPHVPHSCPLPHITLNDEPDISCTLLSENVAPTDKSTCRNGDDELFSRGSCKQLEVNTARELRKFEGKAMAAAEKESSDRPSSASLKKMNRSSSMKEGLSEEQFEPISCLYNSQGDHATRNDKGRQSPLRRILDPIMKPKNNFHLTGIIANFPSRHSCELNRTDKSSHGLRKPSNTNLPSPCQARGRMITSNQLSNTGKGTQRDERHVASMKQALLQLAWKNGLPLFMLSSCDSEVLAAAITMRSVSNNDDLECIYRIFSVNDCKKKSMFWSNPGNKSKKHQLITNVVAQLKVSLCKLRRHDSLHVVREFVLLGADLAPTDHKSVDSSGKSELAAIVVRVPPSMGKAHSPTVAYHSNCRGLVSTNSAANISASNDEKCLQTNWHNDDIGQYGLSVIIPSGVHGLSTDGEPSPLIERWRSGGACDCGGWDEGCMLTILGDRFQEHNTSGSFQDCQTTDGTGRFELFIQGGSQEKRHGFSMVSFKEGLYTVDFRSSISLLQAFAICIAVLHGRKPNNHSAEPKGLQEHIVNAQLGRAPARTQGGDPTSYVPNHPPLSPVGRA